MSKLLTARLSLSLIALLSCSPAVFADVTVERFTTVEPLAPPASVTTIKQIVTPDVEASRRLLIFPANPVSSSSSVTTITDVPFSGKENFARRLELMKEQLDTGISRGWIHPEDAAVLNQDYVDLVAQLNLSTAQGMSLDQQNALERRLNQFNIDLSQHMSTASVGIIQ